MQRAVSLVQDSRHVLLSGHLRADGDCIGAQSVLYHALRELGKPVEMVLPDRPDSRYEFIREHTPWRIWDGSLPSAADLLIVCDCSSLGRLGAMGEAVAEAGLRRIAVDHHVLPPDHGWDALVHDEAAAASGLLALRFAAALGAKELPPAAYEAAFVALMTDTGWLKYSNSTPEAWRAAADLVAHGVDTERVYARVYQRAEPGRPAGIRAALRNLEYHVGHRVALSWVSRAQLAEVGGSLEDSDEVLDILRSVEPVEGVAVVSERSDGRAKASLRSKHLLDVERVARALGGGGHVRAAGVTFPPEVGLTEAVDRVRAAMVAAMEELLAASAGEGAGSGRDVSR